MYLLKIHIGTRFLLWFYLWFIIYIYAFYLWFIQTIWDSLFISFLLPNHICYLIKLVLITKARSWLESAESQGDLSNLLCSLVCLAGNSLKHVCYLRSIIDSKRNKNVEKELSHKYCEIWIHLNIFQRSNWVSEVPMQSCFQNEKTSWNARDLFWYFV